MTKLVQSLQGLISLVVCLFALTFSASADRKITEEARVFQALRDGVFTVFGDKGHGSGFLIDEHGVVLTNQHVVANSTKLAVQINDSVKVPSQLLLEDEKRDIAAIFVHPSTVSGLPVLEIRRNTDDFAFEGERVVAIGSPLKQSRILTSGIISKLEEKAIISDVNINPGNSGGPLINMDKQVIAINTFLDRTVSGPGI